MPAKKRGSRSSVRSTGKSKKSSPGTRAEPKTKTRASADTPTRTKRSLVTTAEPQPTARPSRGAKAEDVANVVARPGRGPRIEKGKEKKGKNPDVGHRISGGAAPVRNGLKEIRVRDERLSLGLEKIFVTRDLFAALHRFQPRIRGISLRRPDDLFVGTLFHENLRVNPGEIPQLERENAGQAARLILELPPQAFGEEALLEETGPEAPVNPPAGEAFTQRDNAPVAGKEALRPLPTARLRMAGPSRLVFTMPADVTRIPYSFAGVLAACRTWPMSRALAAQPPPFGRIGKFRHDAAFLSTLIGSEEFQHTRSLLTDALTTVGGPALDRLARNAGVRLARLAATLEDPVGAGETMVSVFSQELDGVSARTPSPRDPELRALVASAVGFYASGALADLARMKPELDLSAVFPMLPFLIRPQPVPWNATKLEIPYRLIVSPVGTARFEHDVDARAKNGRHELWHTHLTTSNEPTGPDRAAWLRAIWSDDYALPLADRTAFTDANLPFRMSLDPTDRAMLVDLMAGFHRKTPTGSRYQPRPSTAHRLHLSALGALLDAEGAWSTRPELVDVQEWRHQATLGRDHYVRVVYAGFLWPFGHAASLIKVTERKFESTNTTGGPASNPDRVAILRQRFFIVVREHTKSYSGARHVTGGHVFPFSEVELLTRVTPNLLAPGSGQTKLIEVTGKPVYVAGVAKRMAFWPMTAAAGDFRFEIAATDRDGTRSTFAMPLLFVGEIANTLVPDNISAAYAAAAVARRSAPLNGATVAFAPVDPNAKGDTRLPTQGIRFTAGTVSLSNTLVNVYPEVEEAQVGIRAVQRLLGRENAVSIVKYGATYRANGFGGPNKGELFLELVPPWSLTFGGDSSSARTDTLGALASPAMGIAGLSRVMGPASDLANIVGPGGGTPQFDPAKFFKDAKILGGIPLASLLDVVVGITGANVPKLLSRTLPAAGGLPERAEARFEWATQITKSDPLKLFVPKADPSRPTTLTMNGVMSAPVADPAASTFEADARMDNFKVNLFGFIILWFIQLRFDVKRGQKPDVAVDLHPTEGVTFGGPLEFVNTLKDLIPGSGFSDPPSLSVTPSGISASYSLSIPSPQIGIFALSNLSIGAGFSLPFDSRPVQVTFNFCTRERPFSLTVSLLGGGGFFALGIGAEGVREIEAAIEFGAAIAIDLGVASGGVEIKAGVYFHWITAASGKGVVELTGYVRLHGELSILGIISASLTFNLQLSYLKEGSRSTVWGQATLTISIDILFISIDVSVSCRREFAGSPSDPTFLDLVPDAASWQQYCLAYGED